MRAFWIATLWLASSHAMAQQAATADDTSATTLGTLTVRPDPEEVVDLYRFENPVDVAPTVFSRRWKEPTSLEQLGKNGGIVPILVGLAAQQVQKGARKIPGWKEPEQPATARPPPLDEQQAARALRLHNAGDQP
ncbi:hypothetical protein FB548_3334 [Pseudoxanthomonas sp. 3HH-4]|uniref:hypothetical protein n=1 Tax=Pseudoxanthomonas sp. 3HH-4 TaxID=1690214 RepID=UPI00114F727D|nr:hypothetical protein [Pseudoxanthomonas sp. 3HH-4]TQM06958.1 hypothetical protein FB548_3334 [Pseudoxanthomonas sp. 3HH-4]